MALMVEKAAYEDFVKREKENFQRFKGDNAPFDDTEFLQYQNTVMKAKHGQVVSRPIYLCSAPYNTVTSTNTSHRYRRSL